MAIMSKNGVPKWEKIKSSVLYLNGRPLLNISEMPSITFDSDVDTGDIIGSFSQDKNYSFTATFKHLKISRKKFVHNLMKQGYSKKAAKQLAWYCNRKRISYGAANNLIALGLSVR